jgi:hypothetical protein
MIKLRSLRVLRELKSVFVYQGTLVSLRLPRTVVSLRQPRYSGQPQAPVTLGQS